MEKVQREEKNGYVLYHNPGGKTIGTATGRVIHRDGLVFRDLCGTGELLPFEDWRLPPQERAADLAALVGYTEYYLTHKFKAETGLCINDYIKFAKIERAKVLLKSTDQTVQEIAASLCFSTRNYFSRIFQEVTGQTPMEYRQG